jgi:NAD(P)-dependent dehydrogenase (short-subunit alcohol dehydrogenase family)
MAKALEGVQVSSVEHGGQTVPRNMNLKRKIVLVTGSTDGVGRLVACRLADQGARVLIHGRNRDRGKELVEQIQAARGSPVFLPADFSSLNEVRRLADVIPQECDRLDLLINNAGIGSGGSVGKRETSQDGYSCASPSITLPGSCSRGCCSLL